MPLSKMKNQRGQKINEKMCYLNSFSVHMTRIINTGVVKVCRFVKFFMFSMEILQISINRSGETTVELET